MARSKSVSSSRDKLLDDFNQLVGDTEQLLSSLASVGGEKTDALRSSVQANLEATRERLREFQQATVERTTAAARATDDYVHENPWQAIGVAAAVGMLVGLLISRR